MIDVSGHVVYNGRHPNGSAERGYSFRSTRDDSIVARFRAAGAIILGVTIMTEGGTSPLGYNAHFQGPSNPYSPHKHYSGGSSSGSAVAVATGLVRVCLCVDLLFQSTAYICSLFVRVFLCYACMFVPLCGHHHRHLLVLGLMAGDLFVCQPP